MKNNLQIVSALVAMAMWGSQAPPLAAQQLNRGGPSNAREHGYEEGYRAGQADRADGWNFDYQSSDAYLDGSYGYDGYYVDFSEYQYYFREGFRRGYEDGYYSRSQYGQYSNGGYSILGAILQGILNLQSIN